MSVRNIDDVVARLSDVPEVMPDLELLVVFGSTAKGGARAASDVDLAVRCTGSADLEALYRELAPRLGTDRLDLIDLRRAGPVLAFEVARSGRLIYESRGGRFREFQSLASRRYCDTAKLRRAQRRAIEVFLERDALRRKLGHLMTSLDLLRTVRTMTIVEYRADVWRRKGIERVLQEAIEGALDVNAHLIAELGIEVPDDYFGGFAKLSELGVLPSELAHALAPSAGLRNRLVHEYDQIDDAKVLTAVGTMVDLYPGYIQAIENHLDKLGR